MQALEKNPVSDARAVLQSYATDPRAVAFGISAGVKAIIAALDELEARQAVIARALLEVDHLASPVGPKPLSIDTRRKLLRYLTCPTQI